MQLVTRFTDVSPIAYSAQGLSEGQLHATAPSIFADGKHASRSERYVQIPTIAVLDALRREGFAPVMACQSRVRHPDRRNFTKYMVRLRQVSAATGADVAAVGDADVDEIILVNSHDGSCSYQLLAGVFRFVCANGLVCGAAAADVRLAHRQLCVDDLVQAALELVDEFPRRRRQRTAMATRLMGPTDQQTFARAAVCLRYGPEGVTARRRPSVGDVLAARRSEDAGDDLWSVFNRVQESLVRGGVPLPDPSGRRVRSRPIQSIDRLISLNRQLWALADAWLQRELVCWGG